MTQNNNTSRKIKKNIGQHNENYNFTNNYRKHIGTRSNVAFQNGIITYIFFLQIDLVRPPFCSFEDKNLIFTK